MLSPSLSLTFSELLSIILPSCATLERPVRRLFGRRFAAPAGWESGDVFGLGHPLRDLSVVGTGRWVSSAWENPLTLVLAALTTRLP